MSKLLCFIVLASFFCPAQAMLMRHKKQKKYAPAALIPNEILAIIFEYALGSKTKKQYDKPIRAAKILCDFMLICKNFQFGVIYLRNLHKLNDSEGNLSKKFAWIEPITLFIIFNKKNIPEYFKNKTNFTSGEIIALIKMQKSFSLEDKEITEQKIISYINKQKDKPQPHKDFISHTIPIMLASAQANNVPLIHEINAQCTDYTLPFYAKDKKLLIAQFIEQIRTGGLDGLVSSEPLLPIIAVFCSYITKSLSPDFPENRSRELIDTISIKTVEIALRHNEYEELKKLISLTLLDFDSPVSRKIGTNALQTIKALIDNSNQVELTNTSIEITEKLAREMVFNNDYTSSNKDDTLILL